MRDGLITVNAILKEFFSLHLNEFAVKRDLIRTFLGHKLEKTTSNLNREIILSMLDKVAKELISVTIYEEDSEQVKVDKRSYLAVKKGFDSIYHKVKSPYRIIIISSVIDTIIKLEAKLKKCLFYGVGKKRVRMRFNSHLDSDVSTLTNSSSNAIIIARKEKPKIKFHDVVQETPIPRRTRKNRCI